MCYELDDKSLLSFIFVLIGSSISAVSIFNNALIFYCLFRSPRRFQCYFQFLLILSLFDIIISICYAPVILIDSLKDWLGSVRLARIWWSYFVYMLTITHVAMTASSFVLVGALFERYLITIRSFYLKSFQSKRSHFCLCALIVALVTKGGIVLELDVFPEQNVTCKNTVHELYVDVTPISSTLLYGTVYRFWARHFITVFLPFILLLIINVRTVLELKNQLKGVKGRGERRFPLRNQNKSKVRGATRTLLLVCGLYLLSNVPNVVITAWEFVDMSSLQTEFFEFYMFSTDLVSLLVVSACALRLPIYMLSNPELRRVITRTMRNDFTTYKEKSCKTIQYV